MTTLTPLAGQVALVTGAGRGIGAAMARKLASLDATVVLCGRTLKTLEATTAAISALGGRARATVCDVCSLESVQSLAAAIEREFGRIDILVNNAGIGSFSGPLHEMTPEQWEKLLKYEFARRFLLCAQLRAPDDPGGRRSYREHLLPRRKECSAEWRRLCCLEVGIERAELFHCGGTARTWHSGLGGLPRFGGHRTEPAHRKGLQQDAQARRRGPRGGNAGDTGAAIVRQRSPAAADAKTLRLNL